MRRLSKAKFRAPEDRHRFMAACEQVVEEAGAGWVRFSGDVETRLTQAVAAIEALGPAE